FFFCYLILFIYQSILQKCIKKPTTQVKRQKQLCAQHKPNQTKTHQKGKKTETRLPHVFKRVRANTRLHRLHQIGNRRRTNTVTTGT
ncbi:unnamed protein product, partial [Brassica oleracea]